MKLRNKGIWGVGDRYHLLFNYEALAKFNEQLKDYKPVEPIEPLVERRSQRAVLRAAARLADTDVATVLRSKAAGGIVIFDFSDKCRVELKDSGINVRDRGFYSLTQLCGKEE